MFLDLKQTPIPQDVVDALLRELEGENMDEEMKQEEPKLPDMIEEVDVLALEKCQLRDENLQLKAMMIQNQMAEAKRVQAEVEAKIKAKYKLGDQDQIDTGSRKIFRKG
jgi:hypothetical protein